MKKIAFLCGLAIWGLNAYSQPLCFNEEKCVGPEDNQACFRVTYGMHETQYPWLNQFIWQQTFPETTLAINAENLKTLGKQSLKENLPDVEPEFAGYGDTTIVWGQPEEAGDFVQVYSGAFDTGIGAAHANGIAAFDVLRKSDHSPVKLENILLPGAEEKLSLLLQKSFFQYLMADNDPFVQGQAKDMASGPIMPSDKWHFAKNMIVFDYSPYYIAPYAFGDIYLPLAVPDLKGLIKEEILQTAKNWPVAYNRAPYYYPEYCGSEG